MSSSIYFVQMDPARFRASCIKNLSLLLLILCSICMQNVIPTTQSFQTLEGQPTTSMEVTLINQISSPDSTNGSIQIETSVLPPPERRPKVSIDLRERAQVLAETIHIVSDRANCQEDLAQFYKRNSKFHQVSGDELRKQILEQMDILLKQHQAAVDNIVNEAERLASSHVFSKSLRVNYTDVHRLRNEQEWQNQLKLWEKEVANLANNGAQQSGTNGNGGSSGSNSNSNKEGGVYNSISLEMLISQNPNFGISGAPTGADKGNMQPTSINGGAPVQGPPEMQTPIRTIHMQVNKNFGDIPVNTSMSAVHLPLPIYAGLPQIMNTIAWTEGLDEVFRRNLANFAHVHHQYYGDHLGPLRTFPAHKWRIPRLEPDLFDARTRPWYSAGVATPKDVVILVDTSGSMTGLRREIAKAVVFEILDTLANSDHFAVLRFSETVTPIGLPKCQIRKPRLSLDLHTACQPLYETERTNIGNPNPLKAEDYPPPVPEITYDTSNPFNPNNAGQSMKIMQSVPDPPQLRQECEAFKDQWRQQQLYRTKNPSMVAANNGSYITNEAYFYSLRNVTSDIRDAYLLPANSRNIRYLKANFSIPTNGIANFTHALMSAFEIINAYNRTEDLGSQCNKAIMLITDGAIRSHEEVFNRYNYPDSPVRVFTYMIGREVGDIRPTKAMACNNRGYYTNVINLSEIREQVLKYLPVFARPAILAKQHPVSWTNSYGDETYQVHTDWALELKRRERARMMLMKERERFLAENQTSSQFTNIEITNIAEYDDLPLVDEQLRDRMICEDATYEDPASVDQSLEEEIDPLGYNELSCYWAHSRRADLLTSVVKPVYNLQDTSIAFERILHKNVWTEKAIRVRDARLLGVGAVDLRIADIIKLAPTHLLGPNAYPILIGPNGFLLHHPDLRALLEDPFDKNSKILKPNFNSVDLSQVEQVHGRNESELAFLNRKLIKFRDSVSRRHVATETLIVKRTIDCRRRPHARHQTFVYGPVKDTPFSLLLAFPTEYGLVRAIAKLDLNSKTAQYLEPLGGSSTGQQDEIQTNNNNNNNNSNGSQANEQSVIQRNLWTLHPDYRYCEGGPLRQFGNDTSAAIDYLLHHDEPGRSKLWSLIDLEDLTGLEKSESIRQQNERIQCDKNLFPSLLFDAAATSELRLQEKCANGDGDQTECSAWCLRPQTRSSQSLADIFGLEMSFVATRSGLTRTKLYDTSKRTRKLAEIFLKRHPRAIDEAWYARTVDFNMRFIEDAVVVSVQYNAYIRLIAKLRQRITQRQPNPMNTSKSNCDFDYIPDVAEGQTSGSESTSEPTRATRNAYLDDSSPASGQSTEAEGGSGMIMNGQAGVPSELPLANYTSFELLDLIANSSVHVSSHQTVVVHFEAKTPKRTPVAVTGQLYDYSSFAKSFLNKTNILINKLADQSDQMNGDQAIKVDLCPGGECPNKCGWRNDSLDCLLVDFNAFIVVSEDLVHVGRSLAEYDDRLLASLMKQRVFNQIKLMDYQAICTRNDSQTSEQQAARSAALAAAAAAASQSSSSASDGAPHLVGSLGVSNLGIQVASQFLANLASSFGVVAATLYSMFTLQTTNEWSELGELMQLQRSPVVDAQSSSVSENILASLPNKTFLRPCERTVYVYETPVGEARAGNVSSDKPVYYESRCKCPAWYVYAQVPKTNLIMLVVNTTTSCRSNCSTESGPTPIKVVAPIPGSPLPSDQHHNRESLFGQMNRTPEEQVCSMIERADSFQAAVNSRHYDQGMCISRHAGEDEIKLCGSANSNAQINHLLVMTMVIFQILLALGLPKHLTKRKRLSPMPMVI